jgi:hypothetical protein
MKNVFRPLTVGPSDDLTCFVLFAYMASKQQSSGHDILAPFTNTSAGTTSPTIARTSSTYQLQTISPNNSAQLNLPASNNFT